VLPVVQVPAQKIFSFSFHAVLRGNHVAALGGAQVQTRSNAG
jgi:acyl CoA:acetate/3-ketoacid CoA transferase beta subunit